MDSKKIIIAALAALAFNAGMAAAAVYPLTGTKHDLSSFGTGSYRAKTAVEGPGGTTEICIFCHTPHGGNTEAPLWNRASTAENYQFYTSDVLAALNYPAAEDPKTGAAHSRTRICLSCHDGTIALGSVVNMPNNISSTYTEIQMFGNSKIQQSSPGYIGIDLRDDHPVAIPHDNAKDAELSVNITADAPNVNLYELNAGQAKKTRSGGAGSYVECTSCHNPHDNQYGKFLVDSNTSSKICTSCHNKTGDDSNLTNESIHSNTTYSISYPSPVGSSVQNGKCMVCHYPHKSGVLTTDMNTPNPGSGKYLLTFKEEQSCYNTPNRWNQSNSSCHDNGGAGKGIKFEVTKGSAHHVGNYPNGSNSHGAAEVRSVTGIGWANSNWHVECADCHNPHTAGSAPRSVGTNTIGTTSPLYGAAGVAINWPTAWQPLNLTNVAPFEPLGLTDSSTWGTHYEYEICLKCHSSFGWSNWSSPPPTGGTTDQAKEFNTSNGGFHPVAGVNALRYQIPTGSWTVGGGLGDFADSNTMYCSDCHGNNNATPVGPHGSNNAPILRYPSFLTSFSTITNGTADDSTSDLCSKCHKVAIYNATADTSGSGFQTSVANGSINLHNRHKLKQKGFAYRCVNCHTKIPHGYTRRGMIVAQSDIDTDEAIYSAGGANGSKIILYSDPGTQQYPPTTAGGTCNTVAGCH